MPGPSPPGYAGPPVDARRDEASRRGQVGRYRMPRVPTARMDKIYIQDLALRCIIGVFPEERRDKQDVIVNVALEADLRAAGLSDDLEDSVDYKSVKKRIIEIVEGSDFNLVETLAERIAAACLEDPRVDRAVVRVDKPGALRFARSVAVEVDRTR